MFIKSFDENDEFINVEKLDYVCWVRYQIENGIIVTCKEEQAQGVVSEAGDCIYFKEGSTPRGNREKWYIEITEAEYEELKGEEEDPEDDSPKVPEGQEKEEIPTRAELAERVVELERQNEFLSDCLIELSEAVYA